MRCKKEIAELRRRLFALERQAWPQPMAKQWGNPQPECPYPFWYKLEKEIQAEREEMRKFQTERETREKIYELEKSLQTESTQTQ